MLAQRPPDEFCRRTRADGDCVSRDPRCPHWPAILRLAAGSNVLEFPRPEVIW